MSGLTKSEILVNHFCERNFLKFWTHPNPIGKKDKELCDCLIVCGNHVIIISVKECEYKDTGDNVGFDRWNKVAVNKSVSQIWGAERFLRKNEFVTRKDGRRIHLPTENERIYHRISISLGGKGKVYYKWGDFGNGFVHVYDEINLEIIFNELDTITDFVEFLIEVERFVNQKDFLFISDGSMEDLLALYLGNNNSLNLFNWDDPSKAAVFVDSNIWRGFSKSKVYLKYKKDIKNSYIWDQMIEDFLNQLSENKIFNFLDGSTSQNDSIFVEMALQPRFIRNELAKSIKEVLLNPQKKIKSRIRHGYFNTTFVFLFESSEKREQRSRELLLRCFVARGIVQDVEKVVGIALDKIPGSKMGFSYDFIFLDLKSWSPENEIKKRMIQEEFGYFLNVKT